MPTPLERGVFFPHAGPARRQEVRTAVSVVASLLLFGCDASRPRLSTAPVAASDADSVAAIPDETFRDPAPSANLATATALGGPIAGLNAADLARFMAGQEEFEEVETVETGLGPIFNEASCVTCHDAPVGGTTGRIETRFGSRAT